MFKAGGLQGAFRMGRQARLAKQGKWHLNGGNLPGIERGGRSGLPFGIPVSKVRHEGVTSVGLATTVRAAVA